MAPCVCWLPLGCKCKTLRGRPQRCNVRPQRCKLLKWLVMLRCVHHKGCFSHDACNPLLPVEDFCVKLGARLSVIRCDAADYPYCLSIF